MVQLIGCILGVRMEARERGRLQAYWVQTEGGRFLVEEFINGLQVAIQFVDGKRIILAHAMKKKTQ